MSHELYERLRRLRERGTDGLRGGDQPETAAGKLSQTGQVPPQPEGIALPGWEQVAPLVYRRETSLPLPAEVRDFDSLAGKSVLLSVLHAASALAYAGTGGGIGERGVPRRGIRIGFYDTETTGLSGGAGSYIFLFGTGRVEGDSFVVEQYLLGDYPGEPEFIARIESRLTQFDILVSYNGKAFDSHLLSTRFLMNRRSVSLPAQLDLLYPARSLYRTKIGSCALSDMERELLQVTRELDVPGFMIPGIYFAFLRSSDILSLEPVAAHHLEDICSLLRLMTRIERDLSPEAQTSGIDVYQAARLLIRHGHSERARELLERNRATGESGGAETMLLARLYLKAGALDDFDALWKMEFEQSGSVEAGIELAKLLEHRHRDLRAALAVVDKMLAYPEARIKPWKELLRHRLARLERRISRSGDHDR